MGVNDGFSETYIFWIKHDIFKVVINFTKGMYTVYASNGRILLRVEKVSQRELRNIKKKIKGYMDRDNLALNPFHSFKGFRIA